MALTEGVGFDRGACTTSLFVQVLSLHEQISEMQHRAEAAEAATAAAAVHYSQAQHETAVAQAAQYTAEEARRTADAATKLVTQRLAGEGMYSSGGTSTWHLTASCTLCHSRLSRQHMTVAVSQPCWCLVDGSYQPGDLAMPVQRLTKPFFRAWRPSQ